MTTKTKTQKTKKTATTKKTDATPVGKKVTREFSVELDDQRYAELARRQGSVLMTKSKLEAEYSEVKARWKERLDPLTTELDTIEAALRDGKETMTAETTMVVNYDERRVEYFFNGKVVDSRDMTTQDEQQAEAPLKNRAKSTKPRRDHKKAASGDREDEVGEDIESVIKAETRKSTKHTSTDGPSGNGIDGAYDA